ncbi:unnamed protein product [Symbiodinium microadriaticum]|nr:unnamed protein product [Symbiodinium microadriaticum]
MPPSWLLQPSWPMGVLSPGTVLVMGSCRTCGHYRHQVEPLLRCLPPDSSSLGGASIAVRTSKPCRRG